MTIEQRSVSNRWDHNTHTFTTHVRKSALQAGWYKSKSRIPTCWKKKHLWISHFAIILGLVCLLQMPAGTPRWRFHVLFCRHQDLAGNQQKVAASRGIQAQDQRRLFPQLQQWQQTLVTCYFQFWEEDAAQAKAKNRLVSQQRQAIALFFSVDPHLNPPFPRLT